MTMPRLLAFLGVLLSTTLVEAKLVRSNSHVKSICSMWGKDHFKTFDGDVFQFAGTCEYNLVSDCHSSFQDFSVHFKKQTDNDVGEVMVTIKDLPIRLTKQKILVGGEIVSTPYHVSGILIEENPTNTKLQYKLGLSVTWNRQDAVMVELDSKYANRTCGLCGDYNGVPIYDEFIVQGRRIGAIEFGNKHKIHNPNVDCEDPYEEEEEEEELQLQQQQETKSCLGSYANCTHRLLSPAWASCASVLDPGPYISACGLDLCHHTSGDPSAMCATLAEYSRQCSHAQGTPPNWRTPSFCAMTCPYNMVYLESGSPCINTCMHRETNALCEEHHVDGCFCPEGTVFDDISKRGCIPKEQCQCKHGKIYNDGEGLSTDTEECVCHEGLWSCKSHAIPGTCAVEEGSHVTTFDGKDFTFHGNCFYVVSKDCSGSKFSILGELMPCSSQDWDTCLKKIVFRLMGDKRNDLIIQANGKVFHNAEVNLPYSTADVTIFQPSTFHIILQTQFGLQLQIQLVPLMQLYISLDQSFKMKTCGLCGNFNMKLSDDLTSPQGMIEGTAVSFANSWKAQASCADTPDRLDDPCSLSMDNENFAEHWCSLLKSKESPFSKCHTAVNPEAYYKRCKYASCTCDKSEECLCAVVSSYVRACATKGVFLPNWRDAICKKYTDHCPATQTFSYQLSGCQRTCRSLSSERQACSPDFLPVDGCTCPEGLYMNDAGLCVPMNKCPCLHNGDYIKPGKSINIKEEHCVCTNGKLHCKQWKKLPRGCTPPKVFFNCSAVTSNQAGSECLRTCRQRDVDCVPSECESGCRCPEGLLDDGMGHCVKDHDCPCHHDGHFYSSGAQIPLKCNKCTCMSGHWKCTDNKCPSTCTIYGSGHYQTFDDLRFGFNGDCSYIATQDQCGGSAGSFHVITENVPCGTTGTTCSKSIRIVLGKTELRLSDGTFEELDQEPGPKNYTVRNVGLYLVIESDIGLTAFWDRKTTVRIILQPEHTGKVCGLCGNFNGDGQDDFITNNELPVSDVLEFANSWKAIGSCPDAEDKFDPCSKAPGRETWANMQCSIIKGETFKNCHSKVNPTPYFENCVKDSCACDSGGDCECFCTAVAAYAQACNEAGVCVVWRTPDICPVYCDYYNGPANCTWHYSPCHTPCYKTCLHPEGVCHAPIPNLEGCYPICPEDKPIYDEDKQECVEECEGCIIDGDHFKPGQEVPTDKLCHQCFCDQTGNLSCNRVAGCCIYNGTMYEENEVIYDVTDNMGMCYLAICINETVIHSNNTCGSTTTPSTMSPTAKTAEITTPETSAGSSSTPTKTTGTSVTTPVSSLPTSAQTLTSVPTILSTTEKTTSTLITSGMSSATTKEEPSSAVTSTGTVPTTTCVPFCEWTGWFSVSTPLSRHDDDDETYDHIKEKGRWICDEPEDILCRAVLYPDYPFEEFIADNNQNVDCNLTFGLLCEAHKQTRPPKKCFDYEINAYCCKPCFTTTPGVRPSTSTTTPTTSTTSAYTTAGTSESTSTSWKTTISSSKGTSLPPSSASILTTPTTGSTIEVTQISTTPSTQPSSVTSTTGTPKPLTPTPETPEITTTYIVRTESTLTSTKPPTQPQISTAITEPPKTSTQAPTAETTEFSSTTKKTTEVTSPYQSSSPSPSSTTTPSTSTTTTKPPQTSTPTPTSETTEFSSTTKKTTEVTSPHLSSSSSPTSTTTTGPPKTSTSAPLSSPTSKPTQTKPTSATFSTTTQKFSTEATTSCVCTINGIHYNPGDVIFDKYPIGSGICLTMICSDICEFHNSTGPCPTSIPSTTTNTPTTHGPGCPEWDKVQNETFWLCNCTMARCIEDNIIEIIPFECPPLEDITCANGKEPILIWDENACCQKRACDCYCEGWGDPHYVTFDGHAYSHQGNCTYVLMEEIHRKVNFKIYVDNVKCDPREDVSCPRSIIISYNSDVVTLKNNNLMGAAKLEAQMDGSPLRLPYAKNGFRVSSSGLKLTYEIPQLGIVVTFGIVGFTVNLPYQIFGNNTQGHCGTCNNNPHDDCRLPSGQLVGSCEVMADFWPAKDVYRPDCPVPDVVPTGSPAPLPTFKPCNDHSECDLILSDLFAACHPHISPDRYFDGCVFDSCHMSNPVVECTSLQIYAETCAQIGVCVHWRNHTTLCASNCPDDKVYKPCGPLLQPTCEDNLKERSSGYVTEGCFCPEGTKLFSKTSSVCVDKCGCLDSEGNAREFNERFEYNCQDCVCEESSRSIRCQPKQCPPPIPITCSGPGLVPANLTDPSDSCCTQLTCKCDLSTCPQLDKKCAVGYEPMVVGGQGKCCQEIVCEPKPVCVHKGLEYRPGESVPVIDCQDCKCTKENDPSTPWFKIDCHYLACDEECKPGYEYQFDYDDYDACCGECVQTHCALNISGTIQLLKPGGTWSPPSSKCVIYSCVEEGGQLILSKSNIQCPPFKKSNCQPGTIQTLSNGCCQVCEPLNSGCKMEKILKTIRYQGCQTEEEIEMNQCEGACNAYSKYHDLEATMKHTCSCCRESRTSNRTVTLTCLDGTRRPYTYTHVEDCECSTKLCDAASPQSAHAATVKVPQGRARLRPTAARRTLGVGSKSPLVKRDHGSLY